MNQADSLDRTADTVADAENHSRLERAEKVASFIRARELWIACASNFPNMNATNQGFNESCIYHTTGDLQGAWAWVEAAQDTAESLEDFLEEFRNNH